MNPAVILALIADLYEQVATLQAENAALREQSQAPTPRPGGVSMPTWDQNGPTGSTV